MDDLISRQAAIDGKISIQRANGVEIYTDEAVPVAHLKNVSAADVVPYSIESDGTMTITVPKGTKRIGRILIEEDGTQYGGLFYPDTGGCFLSSMERSEQDG